MLEAWVFAHFDAPYPNDHDKNLLAALTGMPRAQVRLLCCCLAVSLTVSAARVSTQFLGCLCKTRPQSYCKVVL